ncbi:hypothetical protein H6F88_00555 [Oculatella sp. FACHB-28]|uniref:hypothetical protein n=1 Tax=Oculatella sp. FACHB-28 TaxID=2692845 RepID=UPI0016823649|nr:hypothetical protein [Oculatella sp. FACHB-28]MBD2054537.1 hypothetical protein [Oculatella sp. FACHB-28]
MPRCRPDDKAVHRVDELLSSYSIPEQILGEQGLLKRLVERAAFHHSSRFCCRRAQAVSIAQCSFV